MYEDIESGVTAEEIAEAALSACLDNASDMAGVTPRDHVRNELYGYIDSQMYVIQDIHIERLGEKMDTEILESIVDEAKEVAPAVARESGYTVE